MGSETTPTLTAFVLARIDDDDDYIRGGYADIDYLDTNRLTAEVEAKRRIMEAAQETLQTSGPGFPADDSGYDEAHSLARHTLKALATIWADHADYRDEWRP